VRPFYSDVRRLEHQAICCHQLRELGRLLVVDAVDLGAAYGHARAGLAVLLVESCTGMARLPVVEAFLYQHLTHRETRTVLV